MKNETEKKYYVVGILWVGPDKNNEEHIDFNRYEITTEPPNIKSSDGFIQIQTFGHLGTNDGVARYAHGQFDSLAAAEHAAIDLLEGEYRRDNYVQDRDVLAVYRPGKYEPVSDDELTRWVDMFLDRQQHKNDPDKHLVLWTSAIRRQLKCAGMIASDERIENEILQLLKPEEDTAW